MSTNRLIPRIAILVMLGVATLSPAPAMAHCDGMDGPVVLAARKALETGDVNLVLIWVQNQDEQTIRSTFDHTRAVRKLGPDAKRLADNYFFETVVRIHRAGEGAPYTGLKPAGRDLGPAIPLADRALTTGKVDELVRLVTDELEARLTETFEHAHEAKEFSSADLEAGRKYVNEYVTFIHYVERAYEAASEPVGGHFPDESNAPEKHDH